MCIRLLTLGAMGLRVNGRCSRSCARDGRFVLLECSSKVCADLSD
jgi:hypothetical protein